MLILNFKHILLTSYYFFKVRPDLISFFLYRSGFPFFFLIYQETNLLDISLVILSWLSFMAAYEIGYIDNDYYAIKYEDKPSIRLSENQEIIGIVFFVIIRVITISSIFLITANYLNIEDASNLLVLIFITLFIFIIHNRLKRKNRILSYSILKSSHLFVPLILVSKFSIIFPILLFYTPSPVIGYMQKIGYFTYTAHLQKTLIILQLMIFFISLLFLDLSSPFMILSLYLLITRLLEIFIRRLFK